MPQMPPPHWPGPPARTVVEVVAARGGFARAFGCAAGLLLMVLIFGGGVLIGVLAMVAQDALEPVTLEQRYRAGGSARVAIISVEGAIDEGMSRSVQQFIRHVEKDPSIRAVVLRVESGGGGVTASDQIWNAVDGLRKAGVPVVASFGGVAASGGYYVACGSDRIVAEPTTITGSIGVIAQIFTLQGLMQKVGVVPVTLVASGSPMKSVANDIFREWTPEDRAQVQMVLDTAYRTFVERVGAGRRASLPDAEAVKAVATGVIFTAQAALQAGLIDQVGYLEDAITSAEAAAGLKPGSATVVRLIQPPSLFPSPLGLAAAGSRADPGPLDAERIRSLANELAAPRILYQMTR